jgi:RHS repeat-associated protein
MMPDYCSQKPGTETQEKYSGKELDNEGSSIGVKGLSLYYYGARYYDPEIGRWTSPDPKEDENIGINPYHFVRNNPMRWVDAWGYEDAPYGTCYDEGLLATYTREQEMPDFIYGEVLLYSCNERSTNDANLIWTANGRVSEYRRTKGQNSQIIWSTSSFDASGNSVALSRILNERSGELNNLVSATIARVLSGGANGGIVVYGPSSYPYNITSLPSSPTADYSVVSDRLGQAWQTHQQFHLTMRNTAASLRSGTAGVYSGTEGGVGIGTTGIGLIGGGAAMIGTGTVVGVIMGGGVIILGTEALWLSYDFFKGIGSGPSEP